MLSLAGKGPRVILTDSLGKYVRVPKAVVKAFPGKTVTKLTDRIRLGQVDISRHERILVHVGTNDVDDVLRSSRTKAVTSQQVLRKYKVLREVIRRRNSRALILFSSILPRLKQFMKFKPYVLELNFALEKWCAKSGGSCVFISSHRSFLVGREPREELFAKDGLHLNGAGVDRLEACFQQTLSTEHLMVRVTAERTRKLWAHLLRLDCWGGLWVWPVGFGRFAGE